MRDDPQTAIGRYLASVFKADFTRSEDIDRQLALIGVDAGDPYGEITSRPFAAAGLPRRLSVKARFAQTVVSLVRHGLGVAIIDEFSVAGVYMPGLARVPLADPVPIALYVAQKHGRMLSSYADYAIDRLRDELRRAVSSRPWRR